MARSRAFYEAYARKVARKAGIDPNVFVRQISAESGFNPNARSGAGAQGIAQIMPFHGVGTDPLAQLRWAANHDAQNLRKYGNWKDALSVYNSGRPWSQGKGISETRGYVGKILAGGAPAAVPLTGRHVDAKATDYRSVPSSPSGQQAVVGVLLHSLQQFGQTGQFQLDPGTITGALSQVQEMKGAGRATFEVDHQEPLSPNAAGVIQKAKQFLGTPYKWGGASPKTGFDCSGFVQWLYGQRGVQLQRTTYGQIKQGKPVGRKGLRPGDVVFFANKGDVHHEGMYIGHGQFIHAPHTGDVVKISSLNEPYYRQQFAGGRRMV